MTLGIVIFAVAILTVIMIHEAGHFVAAKALGFKASKFFIGFGPTLWSFHKGETEYGVKALPVGGFVKIDGMNPYEKVPAQDEARAYMNRPKWARAIVIVAGSATHWVVAFVILVVTAMTIGFPTGGVTTTVQAVETSLNGTPTPAATSGFHKGDHIVAVEGHAVSTWNEVRSYIRDHPGNKVTFTVVRDGHRIGISPTLGRAIVTRQGAVRDYAGPQGSLRAPRMGEQKVGFLGVGPAPEYRQDGLVQAVGTSTTQVWDLTKRSVQGIGSIFSMVTNGDLWHAMAGTGARQPSDGPIGIVGAGRVAGETSQNGDWIDLIGLIVGFTVFVGLMNLLPLPPLDGGHLAVVGYEAVTGRRADVKKLVPVAAAVISFFVLLSIAVLYLDLARPIQTPF